MLANCSLPIKEGVLYLQLLRTVKWSQAQEAKGHVFRRQEGGLGSSIAGSGTTSEYPSKSMVLFTPWGFQLKHIYLLNLTHKPPDYKLWDLPENQSKKAFIGGRNMLEQTCVLQRSWASNNLMCILLSYVIIMHHGNVCFQDLPSNTHSWGFYFRLQDFFAAKKSNSNLNFSWNLKKRKQIEKRKQNLTVLGIC